MKKTELIFREILFNVLERKKFDFTQSELSKSLGISLSVVNLSVKKLESIGSVRINLRSFNVIDARKILYYWASVRNLKKDIVFSTRVEVPIREIERIMPNLLFTGYSAYKFRFNDTPSDYSEVYVYADEKEIEIIKKRISKFKISKENQNLFVLKKDNLIEKYKKVPLAQVFADLWNMKEWYAKEFIIAFEKKLEI